MMEDNVVEQPSTDRKMRHRMAIIGITIGVTMLVVGSLGLAYVLVTSQGCPADGYFAEIKAEGEPQAEYQWTRDSDNNCAWTMWDANRHPAPEEAYTNPDMPYPGPTPRPLTGFIVWLGASGALIAGGTAGVRSTKSSGSPRPDDQRAPDDGDGANAPNGKDRFRK